MEGIHTGIRKAFIQKFPQEHVSVNNRCITIEAIATFGEWYVSQKHGPCYKVQNTLFAKGDAVNKSNVLEAVEDSDTVKKALLYTSSSVVDTMQPEVKSSWLASWKRRERRFRDGDPLLIQNREASYGF